MDNLHSDSYQANPLQPDPQLLRDLVTTEMPFGKYQGRLLADVPEPYLVWMAGKGFPAGKLGRQLALIYEIKLYGLESLLEPLRSASGGELRRSR